MSTVINIALGLIGLGIVVFFHELGHFLAAKLVKINVEAFSIGWGNPVLKKKIGSVEYRIGMFPVGGYCKMQGETNYSEAWENMRDGKTAEKGSYLAASPWRRIVVSAGGPLFNLVLAVILLSVIWGAGFEINTVGNKIILASEISNTETFPADIAGIKTGDLIKSINGQEITYYHEIQEIVALNPNKNIVITVERDGQEQLMNVTPFLDKATGAGRVGIYSWIDAVIDTVAEGSPAQRAGLRTGDRIISANGIAVHNSEDFRAIRIQNGGTLLIEYERGGQRGEALFSAAEAEGELGFSWAAVQYRTPNLSIPQAVAKGIHESYRTLVISIKSLKLLFMGIDLTSAVSGPVRITYMIGETAAQSFGQSVGSGLRSTAEFIALISIALCVMNLLPLPIIDGGMIVLFFIELIRKKPIPPKAISIFQGCGMVIIFGLLILAVFGDILFFVRQ